MMYLDKDKCNSLKICIWMWEKIDFLLTKNNQWENNWFINLMVDTIEVKLSSFQDNKILAIDIEIRSIIKCEIKNPFRYLFFMWHTSVFIPKISNRNSNELSVNKMFELARLITCTPWIDVTCNKHAILNILQYA